jgi:hypothetical protein
MSSSEFTQLWCDQDENDALPDPRIQSAKDAMLLALHSHAATSNLPDFELFDVLATFAFKLTEKYRSTNKDLYIALNQSAVRGLEDGYSLTYQNSPDA